MADSANTPSAGHALLGAVALVAVAAGFAITDRSFWIDECVTAEFAKQPTLAECWSAMRRYPEVQLPFYMLYAWSCAHLVSAGEWALRFAGWPWFVAGAAVFVAGIGRVLASVWIPAALIGTSAFAWYYLNEARVYSVQLGCALALVGSGAAVLSSMAAGRPNRRWWRAFLLALLLLCGTSVLGALWGFFVFVGLALLVPRGERLALLRLAPWSAGLCAVSLAALATYYGWTLTLPAHPVSHVGGTNLQTVAFVFYELTGAAGLGPGRNDLRLAGSGALRPFLIPVLCFAVAALLVTWQGARELGARFGARRVAWVAGLMTAAFLLLCALGVATKFRVLGRHATALLPLVWLVMAFGLARLALSQGRVGKLLAAAFFLLSAASCLSIRLASRHEKDDYRGAAAVAKAAVAAGKNVWWNADDLGAAYYGVLKAPGPGRATWMVNRRPEELRAAPEPDLVIVSKPGTYDLAGHVAGYLRERGYRPTGALREFTLWTRER